MEKSSRKHFSRNNLSGILILHLLASLALKDRSGEKQRLVISSLDWCAETKMNPIAWNTLQKNSMELFVLSHTDQQRLISVRNYLQGRVENAGRFKVSPILKVVSWFLISKGQVLRKT